MKNICLNFFLLILSYSSFAQQTYEGTIINKQTRAPIPYITVKLIKEKVATSADGKGKFELPSNNPKPNDTLLFTGVGYKPLKISANQFVNKAQIQLEEDAVFLNEVKVSSAKRKLKRLTLNPYSSELNLPLYQEFTQRHQAAIKLYSPAAYSHLKFIEISRFVKTENYTNKKVHFRVHVFDIDPVTGGPGDDIVHEIIEVVDDGHINIKVDLERYNLIIPGTAFFAGIEWLFIPENEDVGCFISEFKEPDGGKRAISVYTVYYLPIINNIRSLRNDGQLDTWVKTTPYENWEFNDPKSGQWIANIAISATLEY